MQALVIYCFTDIGVYQSKKHPQEGGAFVLAAGEGFEPSHTESESAVLPLHNPAKGIDYYTQIQHNVKDYLPLSLPHNNN